MSDIEYSVITSDVKKSFDCKMSPYGVLVSQAIKQIGSVHKSAIVYLMYLVDYKIGEVEICVCKFNNLHWKQSKFLLALQHKALVCLTASFQATDGFKF